MTTYAVGERGRLLVAIWGTGRGEVMATVARLPTQGVPGDLSTVAMEMTGLSDALWHCYTRSPGTLDGQHDGGGSLRHQCAQAALRTVTDLIHRPDAPQRAPAGLEVIAEYGRRVGRALHALNHPPTTDAVLGEVGFEIAAVESAETGELTGRAQQAVLLTREDASPHQVQAAHHVLSNDPLSVTELLTRFDPTAAAVAAAHWLWAAAEVAAQQADRPVTRVIAAAAKIEPLAQETPSVVLELLELGLTARMAVTSLVCQAMMIGRGELPMHDQLDDLVYGPLTGVSQPELDAQSYASASTGGGAASDSQTYTADALVRLTPLNPQRPGPDLLEDLLMGIRGCWLLYRKHALADMQGEQADQAVEAAFRRAVRARATTEQDRLLPGAAGRTGEAAGCCGATVSR